ncbi:MAG: PKD domain-containing protein [Planctomycetes bacterium]|nr:PKD domain-containing protein [Planctomycetota bacterium]
MMRTIAKHPFALALMLLTALGTIGGERALAGEEEVTIDRADLAGKRFRFSWSSEKGGAVNGIATLKEDGRIDGIGSPNETTWQIDDEGRLIFKHADGRISTRYDRVRRVEGMLEFEGPFLFIAGITHHLVELEDGASGRESSITPAQAARLEYSTQQFVYLDVGETFAFRLKDGAERRIRLVSVSEETDPVIDLMRRAEVKVEIDGEPIALTCAPYVMPTETRGVRIQADTTSGWLDMPKRVQFSVWDATDPIVDTDRFGFPLAGYRLFSHGMQAYNEPVHLGDRDGDPKGQRFYHNYGVDLAGYERRQKVLSAIDGVVIGAHPGEGDLLIRDDRGVVVHFGHLDAILSGIREGARVERGQWVGMLGRRGPSGNFSHLHVGVFLSEADLGANRSARNLNLYPWLVAAYRAEAGPSLLAVARPHKMALAGDNVLFDGSNSMAGGSEIVSYRWEFHDGTRAEGPRAEKVYEKPGCYMASLRVEDASGRADVDVCKVKVYSRSKPEDVIPTLFATYEPSANVPVDRPVCFRIWPQGGHIPDIRIDFGDGAVVQGYEPYSGILHAFADPGIHIVTVTGTAGGLPVTQKVKVYVER